MRFGVELTGLRVAELSKAELWRFLKITADERVSVELVHDRDAVIVRGDLPSLVVKDLVRLASRS